MTAAAAPLPRDLPEPDLSILSPDRLEQMHDAAATVLLAQAALARSGMSVVSEVLRGQGEFLIWERYPLGDVFDTETHSHYFYHAHDPAEMAQGENGHFHLFVRAAAEPDLEPWPFGAAPVPGDPGKRFVHIGAISMDGAGRPLRLFTTNRWVTDETLYPAEAAIALLDHFEIGVAHPNWAVSKWLTGMVRLFRPQFEGLLRLRDGVLTDWAARHPGADTTEDRRLQNTGEIGLDIPAQIARIETALGV